MSDPISRLQLAEKEIDPCSAAAIPPHTRSWLRRAITPRSSAPSEHVAEALLVEEEIGSGLGSKIQSRHRNGFDVTIRARLAVNEDFKLRARWICQLHRPQSSSASRFTAGACGFLNFSQSGERPDR